MKTASLIRRVEASITTAIPMVVIAVAMLIVLNTFIPLDVYVTKATGGQNMWLGDFLTIAIVLILPLIWVAADGARNSATYGMRKRGIKFVDYNGNHIGPCYSLLRIGVGLLMTPLFLISFVIALKDPNKRILPDFFCKTTVVLNAKNSKKGGVVSGEVDSHG